MVYINVKFLFAAFLEQQRSVYNKKVCIVELLAQMYYSEALL